MQIGCETSRLPRTMPAHPWRPCEIGFQHTGGFAGDGLPDGGASRDAHLAGSSEAVLLEEVVGVAVVVSRGDTSQSRNSGDERTLHFPNSIKEIRYKFDGSVEKKKTAKGVKRLEAIELDLKERTKALS